MSITLLEKNPEEAAEPSAQQHERVAAQTDPEFLVVGIGASAGGLAAFDAFFSAMPDDADGRVAFVLVQHLAPDHKSLLAELVKRFTRMQVLEVQDGMKVQPNITYIIPPNRDMTFEEGTLRLSEPAAPRGQRLPIDILFRSLARAQGHRAIGIVLSGTGSDGTLGVRAIKGEGGMAMAQNPASTEFDGMPRSAIATGLVDYVLPPAEMPAALLAYAARISTRTTGSSPPPSGSVAADLETIFQLLRTQVGHDFSQYKRSTISRRIERRIAVRRLEDLSSYVRYLRETPDEVNALFHDLLIGVTQFFRDAEAFATLENVVIPQLIAHRANGAAIRVWVPGCSTGEEAYSIAMLLHEKLGERKLTPKVQIFATDIDARAIEFARVGVYPASIAADISPERLARHFMQPEDGRYRVQKSLRELLIFSEQDVAKDPPFSKLDLITCRNLMIYMGPELQKKLLPLFHYALRPGGFLFLGASETVGAFGELFSTTSREAKIYRREEVPLGASRPVLGNVPRTADADARLAPQKSLAAKSFPLREITQRALLERAPVAALVNEHGDLLYLHGRSGDYLELAPGEVGLNVLKIAREGLRLELASALYKAKSEKVQVQRPRLRVKTNRDVAFVDLTVQPVAERPDVEGGAPFFLVTFEPVAHLEPEPEGAVALGSGEEDPRFVALHRELTAKDEYLRAAEDAMQTTNEELKSSNEELQSTNEELQSTNEELETSKEELQSVNEELATVNAELQSKVSDLSITNNDMNNLLASTGIGTLFVDEHMFVRRFTPAVTQFVNLIPTDIGRPLGHIVTNFVGYDRFVADVKLVVDTLSPQKIEVQTVAGTSYVVRIRPYRTADNAVEGAVVTFTEVMGQKDAQAAMRASDDLRSLAGAARDALDAITVQDLEGGILAWNPGAVRMYGWSEAEALVMNIRSLVPEGQREGALAVIERLSRADVLQPYHTQRIGKNGQLVEVTLTATALVNASGAVYALSTTERGMSQ